MLVREGVRVNEDELTRAVIGLLRYLPSSLWLRDFVEEKFENLMNSRTYEKDTS